MDNPGNIQTNMKNSRFGGLLLGLGLMVGPWIWALFAIRKDPSQGDAQGAFTLATYASLILVPVGLIILVFSLRKRT